MNEMSEIGDRPVIFINAAQGAATMIKALGEGDFDGGDFCVACGLL